MHAEVATLPSSGHELQDRLERSARIYRTPCGEGSIVWRGWGDDGPAIFLLHGGFGSWKHWLRNIEDLSATMRVFAADLPGLGDSDPAPQPHTAQAIGEFIADAVRQLNTTGRPAILAGFSLGSSIAAHAAHQLGDDAACVVVLGPSALGDMWKDKTGELIRLNRSMSLEQVRDVVRQNLAVSMIADPDRIDDLAIDIQRALIGQKRQLMGMPISMSAALLDVLDRMAHKVVIVFGELDCYANPDVASCVDELSRRYPAVRTHVVSGAGHWVMYEAPDAVNTVLRGERERVG